MGNMAQNMFAFFVYLPIGLLAVSVLLDLAAAVFKRPKLNTAGLIFLWIGTLAAIVSYFTGPANVRDSWHGDNELLVQIALIILALASLIRLLFILQKRREIGHHPAFILAALAGALLLAYPVYMNDQTPRDQMKERGGGLNPQIRPNPQGRPNPQDKPNLQDRPNPQDRQNPQERLNPPTNQLPQNRRERSDTPPAQDRSRNGPLPMERQNSQESQSK